MLWWEIHEVKLEKLAEKYDYMKIYHKEYAVVGKKDISDSMTYGIIIYNGYLVKACIYDRITDIKKSSLYHYSSQVGSAYFYHFSCELYKDGQCEKWDSHRPFTNDEPPVESY